MTDNIKLPPYPEGLCLREDIEDYAREAVRLNAQAVSGGVARIVECAQRLVDGADFKLGGCLGPESKPKEIPSNAASSVKARHLAALKAALSAAPAARGEPIDPLQGAANWLLEAIGGCNIRTLEWHLMIDFNRAERLMLAARAAQQVLIPSNSTELDSFPLRRAQHHSRKESAMDEDIKLPEPFGYVSDFKHAGIRIMSFQYEPWDQTHSLYHKTREVYTADQLRAAVEADRVQRVSDRYSADQIAQAAMEAEIPDSKLESLLIALARAIEQAHGIGVKND